LQTPKVQMFDTQSFGVMQPFPLGHGEQFGPPQSMSVSPLSKQPSEHVPIVHAPLQQ
jgi:hypothetical protein